MKSPAACRAHADECMKLASTETLPARRTILLSIARSWNALANQLECLQEFKKDGKA